MNDAKKTQEESWDEFEQTVAAYEKELNEPWSAVIRATEDQYEGIPETDNMKDPYKTTYETGYTEPTGKLIIVDENGIVDENPEHDPTDENWLGSMVNELHAKYPTDDLVDFRFDEESGCHDLLEYIKSTYQGHYTGEKYQATDLIIDAGHGVGFCIGNIIKYAKRYGKKDGFNEKDIMKILHYGIILLHVHRNNKSE